jgi:toxin secretion/phage lysis holin
MENINAIRLEIFGTLGIAGSIIANLLGGWDTALRILILFMAVDYVTGLIVAGIFKKSGKTESGALESGAGWKGLYRKGVTLLIVLVAVQLDLLTTGTEMIRNAVVIGYIANEALSIVENAGLMGIPVPKILRKSIDILQKKDIGSDS